MQARKQENELYELFQNENISEEEYRTKNKKLNEITSQHSTDKYYMVALGEQIKDGHLNGCYINGKKVLSLEERQAIAQQKKAEYEKMKEDLIASTTSSIEQQVSGFGRK